MLKVGIFGVGHLGKIHLQQWKTISQVDIVGFYDPNEQNAQAAIELYQITRYSDITQLMQLCDAIDIVTPTIYHYTIAKQAIQLGKHIFIEKPLTSSLNDAKELIQLVKEANVKCQVGHVERFNPALLSLQDVPLKPMFIESHRLASFNPRGTDVSVILDLMIHDLDIILSLVKSPVKRISASGVSVLSETPDIANARLEFDNGCVANLTSSRISLKRMRKMRLFQRDAYISIDFLEKKSEVIKFKPHNFNNKNDFDIPIQLPEGTIKNLNIHYPEIPNINAIQQELLAFVDSILTNVPVKVSAYDGYQAMDVAHAILKKMSIHQELHND